LPAGAAAANDTTSTKLGDGVTELTLVGGFGCPLDKTSMGFPDQSASIASLESGVSSDRTWGIVGVALGALALASTVLRRRS